MLVTASKHIFSLSYMVTVIICFGYIDHAIGKINTCGITELSGEAGCGKTQYGLVLSCQVRAYIRVKSYSAGWTAEVRM